MNVTGIIAEYNPFHRGHKYQINYCRKELQADYVIVVMSGDYVQRGTPALLPKHLRAEMALRCGADLVLEMPVSVSTASAETFAMAGVSILDNLHVVEQLCFGSEYGEVSALQELAAVLVKEPKEYRVLLKTFLSEGLSFPAARSQALIEYFKDPHHFEGDDFDGILTIGHNVQIGYFAQNQAQMLDENMTVFDTIDRVATGDIRLKIRDILGAFMFGGEASDKKVKVLSGGERTRLAMIKLLLEPVNFLILDEPTNHLDMRSKDVLKEAIREFDGTVILVSHDRDFLDGLATKVYEFGGGTVKEHLGGIYDFLQKKKIDSLNELQKGVSLSTSPTASAKGNEADTEQPSENRLSYEAQKELNKKIKKLERQVADCEASIEETESAIAILEAKMATPEGASDMQLYERHQKLKQQLDTTVEEWERVSMELEEVKN